MNADNRRPKTSLLKPASRLFVRLLQDETGVTTTEYTIAAVAMVLAAIAASRVLTSIITPYLHRIYLVVTLPVP